MNHIFNIEIAKILGLESAIILQNIQYWLSKNKANKKNFHEGKYWTYNSINAFSELFPYMTKYKISKTLNDLEDAGVLISGVFNKSAYDRTKWYTLNENNDIIRLYFASKASGSKISELQGNNEVKKKNGSSRTDQPIPDVNTYINTDEAITLEDLKDNAKSVLESKVELSAYDKNIKKLLSIPTNDIMPTQYLALQFYNSITDQYKTFWESKNGLGFNINKMLSPEDRNRFIDNFNDTVLEENRRYNPRLMHRLNKYSRNWLSNVKDKKKSNNITAGHRSPGMV